MRNESALIVISVGVLLGACKTYTAIPFDAGDVIGDSGFDLGGDGRADDGRFDEVSDRFGGDDAPDVATGPQPDGKPCISNDDCE